MSAADFRLRTPRRGVLATIREAWADRGLMPLIWRLSILVIYHKTILGWLWLLIRPAIAVAVLAFVSRNLLGVQTAPLPFLAFITTSFALWLFFHRIVRHGVRSLTRLRTIARRLPTTRYLFVFGSLAPASVEALVGAAGAAGVLVYFTAAGELQPVLALRVLAAPLAVALTVLIALGLVAILAPLNAIAADTALTLNYALGVVLLLTPVIYPLSAVAPRFLAFVQFNPLSAVFELWRWALLGGPQPDPAWLAGSALGAALIFVAGIACFVRLERAAMDRL
jgi:lipopolysaccharide transport system permease protein